MNTKRYKYPKTFHLPWSPGTSRDDKIQANTDSFTGKEVVVSLKMDGENTTIYKDCFHARSIDSSYHETRTWVARLHSNISIFMEDGVRICGENLYAKHSIHYEDLSSYFYIFSIWKDDLCLSWDHTQGMCGKLGLVTVPVIYSGIFDKNKIDKSFQNYAKNHEGYVVRLAESFNLNQFNISVAKYVRENHVQTSDHWMNSKIIKNKLK